MNLSPADVLSSAIATLDAEEARIKDASAAVAAAKAALEAAEKELAAAAGWNRHSHRRSLRSGLNAVSAALSGGAKAIVVSSSFYGTDPLPGAVGKVTAARATVLTSSGEMTFDLKGSTYKKPGEGMADFSGYKIDPADLA